MDIRWIGSPNSRSRNGQPVKWITLHWMVGRLAGTDAVFQRFPGTATHYGIEDGRVHQYVLESRAAPGTGSNAAIPWDISIEHEGGYLVNGVRKHPSRLTHETSAELVAGIAKRHGLGKLVVGRNVFRHRDWVSTSCPGTLEVEWIVAAANAINGYGAMPAGGTGVLIPSAEVTWIQKRLVVHGFNPGDVDGEWGPKTEEAVRAFQTANNLDPDGVVGPITKSALEGDPHMSAADVTDLKNYISAEVARLRREARPRLYVNNISRKVIAVRVESGYVHEFDNVAATNKFNELGLIAPEVPVEVDPDTYESIKAEARHLHVAIADVVASELSVVVPDIAEADIEAAVTKAIAALRWNTTAE